MWNLSETAKNSRCRHSNKIGKLKRFLPPPWYFFPSLCVPSTNEFKTLSPHKFRLHVTNLFCLSHWDGWIMNLTNFISCWGNGLDCANLPSESARTFDEKKTNFAISQIHFLSFQILFHSRQKISAELRISQNEIWPVWRSAIRWWRVPLAKNKIYRLRLLTCCTASRKKCVNRRRFFGFLIWAAIELESVFKWFFCVVRLASSLDVSTLPNIQHSTVDCSRQKKNSDRQVVTFYCKQDDIDDQEDQSNTKFTTIYIHTLLRRSAISSLVWPLVSNVMQMNDGKKCSHDFRSTPDDFRNVKML